jgi:hypothetical protein
MNSAGCTCRSVVQATAARTKPPTARRLSIVDTSPGRVTC